MAEYRPIFVPFEVEKETRADGSIVLHNKAPLPPYPNTILEKLDHWAAHAPGRVFLGERQGTHWYTVTFAQTVKQVDALAAKLIPLNLSMERPLAILAPNSVLHGLLVLAAQRIGVPAAVISPNYATATTVYDKLGDLLEMITPGALYISDVETFAPALRALTLNADYPVFSEIGDKDLHVTAIKDLEQARHAAVEEAAAKVGPETVAKLLFTSGSTGTPKGVMNTHKMMCSNQAGFALAWPFLLEEPPVLLDWLPWNHTFGGNYCFNTALCYGGSLYIDEGKPVRPLIEKTIANLRAISPTLYFSTPSGWDVLLSFLESDPALVKAFTKKLRVAFNASAALPASTQRRLEAILAQAERKIPIQGGWGSTETAPCTTLVCYETPHAENLGSPLPGIAVKMVPNRGKMELRIKGPNIMPGYYRHAELTAHAFDEEGFYMIGDAGKLIDPDRPELGILFDGRTAENFKLVSGTWVNVSAIRLAAISAAQPLIRDAVVTGHNQKFVGLLIFPHVQACRDWIGDSAKPLNDAEVIIHPQVIHAIQRSLAAYNSENRGSSLRIGRFLMMDEPPIPGENEITDKGYINQRRVLERRAASVETLYSGGGYPAEDPAKMDQAHQGAAPGR
jgi:feruloyl-CoA synthase